MVSGRRWTAIAAGKGLVCKLEIEYTRSMVPLQASRAWDRGDQFIVWKTCYLTACNIRNFVAPTLASTYAVENFCIFYNLFANLTYFVRKRSRVGHNSAAINVGSQSYLSPIVSWTSMSCFGWIATTATMQCGFRWRSQTVEIILELAKYIFQ